MALIIESGHNILKISNVDDDMEVSIEIDDNTFWANHADAIEIIKHLKEQFEL